MASDPEPRARRAGFAERRAQRAAVDDPQVVLEAALRFLETRPRSIAEVRRRLGSHGYRADLIERAVSRLVELGVLDDEVFGRAWLESRDRVRPRGERALRRELLGKGIDRGLVDELLVEREFAGAAGDPEREAATRLLERHRRSLERVEDPRARRQRAWGLLARNGFDLDASAEAVRAFLEDDGPHADTMRTGNDV